MKKNMKCLLLLISVSLLSFGGISLNTVSKETVALGDVVTAYLVLSPIGKYQGEKGQDYPDLFLENTIKLDAPVGSELPDSNDVTTIASSQGTFASWVRYDGLGAPSKYTTVPNENGAILYANFKNMHLSFVSLALSGTPAKTSYDLGLNENVFDSTGLIITATFSDDSTLNVTNSVEWESLQVGMTSIIGSYTYAGITKTIMVTGIEVVGESTFTKIYLNAGGSGLWDQSGAWFAAYCWAETGGDIWYELTSESGYYVADIDIEFYANVIFVRFADTAETMSWINSSTNIWNQTSDLIFEGNCFTITGWNANDGLWSII